MMAPSGDEVTVVLAEQLDPPAAAAGGRSERIVLHDGAHEVTVAADSEGAITLRVLNLRRRDTCNRMQFAMTRDGRASATLHLPTRVRHHNGSSGF